MVIKSLFWLIALIIFVIIELISLGLTTIWFAGGSLVAYILNVAGCSEVVQIVAFFAVSILLLVFTRPFAQKYINTNSTRTNASALVGKTARVTREIDNVQSTGKAVVDGEEWMARAEADDIRIPEGTLVEILEIKGAKIIVKIKEEG